MKKQTWLRLAAFVLALTILSGTLLSAGAANVVGDVNGDGKITIFDAQMIAESNAGDRTLNDPQSAVAKEISLQNIFNYIFGNKDVDAGDTDGDGIQEIYAAEGLERLHVVPEGRFILMNDLDLNGADWTPVANFSGSFDGNGKTISNFTINTGKNGSQGFFADIADDAVITDLNLQNVTVTAAGDAAYLGLLAGTSCGNIENCTVTGIIYDTRESDKVACMGAFVGAAKAGSIAGGASVSITDDAGVVTTDGLCAKVAFVTPNVFNNDHHCFAGEVVDGVAVSGQWADASNDSDLLSEAIQTRQNTAIDYMNAMATVQWTPSETLQFKGPHDTSPKIYEAGKVYTGLPYTHNNGSLERFESVMASKINGVYTTQTGLGQASTLHYLPLTDSTGQTYQAEAYEGFAKWMGNNCSTAVGWAWMQISPVIIKVCMDQTDGYHGGARITYTAKMIPKESVRTQNGIYPVGYWTNFSFSTNNPNRIPGNKEHNSTRIDQAYDASRAAYTCTEEQKYSYEVLLSNGADTMLEAYATARRADAIVVYSPYRYRMTDSGHVRLLVADPVVIRNADNTIDQVRSYMMITEQGAEEDPTSTWLVNRKYTFQELLDEKSLEKLGTASFNNNTYLPVTIRALQEENVRESYVTKYTGENAVTGPATGKLYSNYRIVSTIVTVKKNGNTIYEAEVFTGVSNIRSVAYGDFHTCLLSDHAEGFNAAALAANWSSGTYQFSVQAVTSDGSTHTVVTNQNFTYTAP